MTKPDATEALIVDSSGAMRVFLNPGGDHIVTKFIVNPRGEQFETILPSRPHHRGGAELRETR